MGAACAFTPPEGDPGLQEVVEGDGRLTAADLRQAHPQPRVLAVVVGQPRPQLINRGEGHGVEITNHNREETIITRAGHEPVVIVSLADYESLRETAYLMRSPANARRLLDSIDNLEAGRGQQHNLIED